MFKRLSAHYVFPLNAAAPLKFGILQFEDGILTEIIDTNGNLQEISLMEFHSGVLIPEIEGLSVEKIREQEHKAPEQSLPEILQQLAPAGCSFCPGKKQPVFLLSGLDPATLRTTPLSRIKRLL